LSSGVIAVDCWISKPWVENDSSFVVVVVIG